MRVKIEMPQLSSDGEGATLATWLVSVGDRVEKGEVIAELETDKSTVELEAPASGTMIEFAVLEGVEEIMSGTLLGMLEVNESAISVESRSESDLQLTESELPSAAAAAAGSDTSSESMVDHAGSKPPTGDGGLRGSTPLARRAAVERDVDLETLAGSGPGGRVIEEDVLRSTPDAMGVAEDLTALSLPTGAQPLFGILPGTDAAATLQFRARCPMDVLFQVRSNLNQSLAAEGREGQISINEFIVRAAGLALREVPEAKVGFIANEGQASEDREIRIGLAVSTDRGWATALFRNPDRTGLAALADEVRAQSKQTTTGELAREAALHMTIVNLGRSGIEVVCPTLDSSQSCLLSVAAAEEQPVVRDGEIVVGSVATLTLTIDRSIVDGATAARLLAAVRDRLAAPLSMML
jgi:pyruvate dehydrogenase E2 component (dihydrolipoamide acetyltransferase)